METASGQDMRVPPTARAGGGVATGVYVLVAWLLVASILMQVLFAGLGMLVDAADWGLHRGFFPVVLLLALVVAGLAAAARVPRRPLILSCLAPILVLLQPLLVAVPADGSLGVLRALHPVNALILFLTAFTLARGGRRRS